MFDDWCYVRLRDREVREQELDELIDERQRQAVRRKPSSLRTRMARGLFALAVSAEREHTWRVVWERLEARGRL